MREHEMCTVLYRFLLIFADTSVLTWLCFFWYRSINSLEHNSLEQSMTGAWDVYRFLENLLIPQRFNLMVILLIPAYQVTGAWASVYFFGLGSLMPANQLARLSSDTGVSNGWSMRCVSFSVILCGYGPIILIFLFRYGRIGVVFILFWERCTVMSACSACNVSGHEMCIFYVICFCSFDLGALGLSLLFSIPVVYITVCQ